MVAGLLSSLFVAAAQMINRLVRRRSDARICYASRACVAVVVGPPPPLRNYYIFSLY